MHPWLPFYLLAGFLGVFGSNTWVARLPFALFGFATVILIYFFSQALWKSRRAGLVAVALLILSVPFLILSRQCRYYSLSAFFSILGLHFYIRLTENKAYASLAFLSGCTLLFYTHYIYYAVFLITVLLHAVLFHRTQIKKLLFLCTVSAMLNLPWIIWVSGLFADASYASRLLNPAKIINHTQDYLLQMTQYIFPLPLLLLSFSAAGICLFKCRKGDQGFIVRNLALLLLFIGISILVFPHLTLDPFFRYLTPLIPVCCLIITLTVEWCMKFHVLAGMGVIVFFIFSQPVSNYLYEITHDYDGPVEGIVEYLNRHGKKDDVVAITYEDLPLKFYTRMRVVGGLTGEDLSPAKNADWVILRKHVICEKDFKVRQYLLKHVPWDDYQQIRISYPDIPYQNRESPYEHRYRTVTNEDRVVLYKRMKPPS